MKRCKECGHVIKENDPQIWILDLLKKGPLTIPEIAIALGCSPRIARQNTMSLANRGEIARAFVVKPGESTPKAHYGYPKEATHG